MPPEIHPVVEQVRELFRKRGDSAYGCEAVSQREHALQTAHLARTSGASPALVAAALLHDVGHLLHHLPDNAPEQGVDDRHEDLAARWLAKRFLPEVVEPVRLHVDSKRYLCAVEQKYAGALSEPSLLSLALQGGPMTADETEQFRANPHFAGAVALRRWDDAAKVPQFVAPDFDEYLDCLQAALLPRVAERDP